MIMIIKNHLIVHIFTMLVIDLIFLIHISLIFLLELSILHMDLILILDSIILLDIIFHLEDLVEHIFKAIFLKEYKSQKRKNILYHILCEFLLHKKYDIRTILSY